MDTASINFLRKVWGAQNPDIGINMYLGELSRRPDTYGKYQDRMVRFGSPIFPQEHGIDMFFAPNTFDMERKNETMMPSVWLYADLDEAPYPDIAPTWYWTTSPGNTQALWRLSKPVDKNEHAVLNKALTVMTGADPGGWHASKLLRMPGSYNYKRHCDVSAPTYIEVSYYPESLREQLGPYIIDRGTSMDQWAPPEFQWQSKEAVQLKYWKRLGLYSRSMLVRGANDRSKHVVAMCHQLAKEGFSKDEVFELIWVQDWCKWRVDGHRPHMLAREVSAAFSILA